MSGVLQALLMRSSAVAQAYWVGRNTYATGANNFYATAPMSDGGSVIVGNTDTGGTKCTVARINAATGAVTWARRLSVAGNVSYYSVAVDASDNIYCAGYWEVPGSGIFGLILTKYNASGSIQWQRSLTTGTAALTGGAVALDASGNPYVTFATGNKVYVARYDTSGAIQWQMEASPNSNQSGRMAIAVDTAANLVAISWPRLNPIGCCCSDQFVCVEAFDLSGTHQWGIAAGGFGTVTMYSFGLAGIGSGVFCLGYGYSNNYFGILKISSAGARVAQIKVTPASTPAANNGVANLQYYGGALFVGYRTATAGARLYSIDSAALTANWQRSITYAGATTQPDFYGLAANANGVYAAGTVNVSSVGNSVQFKERLDGTATGTFGSWDYASVTDTFSTENITTTTAFSWSAGTANDAAGTGTDASTSFSATTTQAL